MLLLPHFRGEHIYKSNTNDNNDFLIQERISCIFIIHTCRLRQCLGNVWIDSKHVVEPNRLLPSFN